MLALVKWNMAEVQPEIVELTLKVNAVEKASAGEEFDVIVVAYDEILPAMQSRPKGLEAGLSRSSVVHEDVAKVVYLVAFVDRAIPLFNHMLIHLINVSKASADL